MIRRISCNDDLRTFPGGNGLNQGNSLKEHFRRECDGYQEILESSRKGSRRIPLPRWIKEHSLMFMAWRMRWISGYPGEQQERKPQDSPAAMD